MLNSRFIVFFCFSSLHLNVMVISKFVFGFFLSIMLVLFYVFSVILIVYCLFGRLQKGLCTICAIHNWLCRRCHKVTTAAGQHMFSSIYIWSNWLGLCIKWGKSSMICLLWRTGGGNESVGFVGLGTFQMLNGKR